MDPTYRCFWYLDTLWNWHESCKSYSVLLSFDFRFYSLRSKLTSFGLDSRRNVFISPPSNNSSTINRGCFSKHTPINLTMLGWLNLLKKGKIHYIHLWMDIYDFSMVYRFTFNKGKSFVIIVCSCIIITMLHNTWHLSTSLWVPPWGNPSPPGPCTALAGSVGTQGLHGKDWPLILLK